MTSSSGQNQNENEPPRRADAPSSPLDDGFQPLIWLLVIAGSVGIHTVSFWGLQGEAPEGVKNGRKNSTVEMTVMPKPAPPPPPATPPPPEPEKKIAQAPRAPKVVTASPPPEAPPPEPAQAETPADFTGVTLTNEGSGPGWASAVGSGAAMKGPVGTPGAKVTGKSLAGDTDAGKGRETIVAAGDLSRPPELPDLDVKLQEFHPEEARKKGLNGTALARIRVSSQGKVTRISLLSDTGADFADACLRMLREHLKEVTPPLDKDGNPAATEFRFKCNFVVR